MPGVSRSRDGEARIACPGAVLAAEIFDPDRVLVEPDAGVAARDPLVPVQLDVHIVARATNHQGASLVEGERKFADGRVEESDLYGSGHARRIGGGRLE